MQDAKVHADCKTLWMEGKMVPYAEAQVHVLSHSLHYGSSIFEGIRAYETPKKETAIFGLREHLERFTNSMRCMGFHSRWSLEELSHACLEVVKANALSECYLRPIAYLDDSVRGLNLPKEPKAKVAIAAWKWGKYLGPEGQVRGIRAQTSSFRRSDIASSLPHAKLSGNYITSVLARQEATRNGFEEAILLDQQGFIAEGSGENIFIVKNGKISTPPKNSILPGITRTCVMELCRHLGLPAEERLFIRNELYFADEAFFTGTAVEVTPIREVDYRPIGTQSPGPITDKLSQLFFRVVRGQEPGFSRWLTYVSKNS